MSNLAASTPAPSPFRARHAARIQAAQRVLDTTAHTSHRYCSSRCTFTRRNISYMGRQDQSSREQPGPLGQYMGPAEPNLARFGTSTPRFCWQKPQTRWSFGPSGFKTPRPYSGALILGNGTNGTSEALARGEGRTGGARTFLLTSPQAPKVVPMFLMTVENTVFRSCFSTACSWYVCRVVSRNVLLPNYVRTEGQLSCR